MQFATRQVRSDFLLVEKGLPYFLQKRKRAMWRVEGESVRNVTDLFSGKSR